VAGIVLFGSTMALRRCFPMMRIDYIRVPGRKWVENPDHRFDTLEIRAPLFTAIRRATNTVRDELIQSFSLPEGALAREDEPTLPLRVIRDEESRALVFVRELGAIDNAAYRSINRTDTLNASVHLRRLRDLGLLEMKGAGNRTYYVPGVPLLVGTTVDHAAGTAVNPHQPPRNTHQPTPNTHQPTANTHQPTANTHQPPADTHQLGAMLPEGLRARIPSAGTKPRKNTLRALIRDLCTCRALSAKELAALLRGRDQKHLVREFLSPMVHEGLLAYTIPAMENHPDQRYTVPSASTEDGGTTP
jgi:ATP-dependent DNA helicase RecG